MASHWGARIPMLHVPPRPESYLDCRCGHTTWAHDAAWRGSSTDGLQLAATLNGKSPCAECDCRDYKAGEL